MKTLYLSIIVITICILIVPSVQNAIAIPNFSSQDLYKQSDMVFYGQVLTKGQGPGPDWYYYQVKVITYFKNPQTSDSITVAGHKLGDARTPYPQFEVGDNAIFYIKKTDGINTIFWNSQKAGNACDIHSFLGPAPLPNEPIVRGGFTTRIYITDVNGNSPEKFEANHKVVLSFNDIWNNYPESRTIPVETAILDSNAKTLFYKKQNLEMQACDGPATVRWDYIPTQSGRYIATVIVDNKTTISTAFEVKNNTNSIVVQTALFNGKNQSYTIPYNMTNGNLVASVVDVPAKELIFNFNATGNGKLTVQLPRQIIDSMRDGKDKPYLVFVDNMYSGTTKRVKALEIQNDQNARTLEINFTKTDNHIGIVGTYLIENNSTSTGWNPFGAWSPLQQYNKGFDAQDIVCRQDLQLVIKAEDGSPACTKSDTARKLVEAGWAKMISKTGIAINSDVPISNDDAYLSQTVDEWKSKTPEQLDAYYKKYKDTFYDELGSFLIKNEMKKELERQKIQNVHDDFKVFPGMSLDSLPPHISYDAVVNATDGNSYLLLGGVFANKIESVKITKLVFDKDVLNSLSTDKKPSFANPIIKEPRIVISDQEGTNSPVEPYSLTLDLDKNKLVTFYNNLTIPIRIQPYGSGLTVDEGGLSWKSKVFGPNETVVIQFNKTGYYEWNARSPPKGSENWWDFHGSGQIATFSQSHDNSTSIDKLKMAQVFVNNSDIPWSSTGLGNGDLEIGLYASVYYMIPDAPKYYEARAMQLIPFDVPVVISSPSFTEK